MQNIYLRKYQKLIKDTDMISDEEDRKLYLEFGERAWATYDVAEQRMHLQRKLSTSCVTNMLNWLQKGIGEPPEDYRIHGPEE